MIKKQFIYITLTFLFTMFLNSCQTTEHYFSEELTSINKNKSTFGILFPTVSVVYVIEEGTEPSKYYSFSPSLYKNICKIFSDNGFNITHILDEENIVNSVYEIEGEMVSNSIEVALINYGNAMKEDDYEVQYVIDKRKPFPEILTKMQKLQELANNWYFWGTMFTEEEENLQLLQEVGEKLKADYLIILNTCSIRNSYKTGTSYSLGLSAWNVKSGNVIFSISKNVWKDEYTVLDIDLQFYPSASTYMKEILSRSIHAIAYFNGLLLDECPKEFDYILNDLLSEIVAEF